MDGKEEQRPPGHRGNSGETCDGCGWPFLPEKEICNGPRRGGKRKMELDWLVVRK